VTFCCAKANVKAIILEMLLLEEPEEMAFLDETSKEICNGEFQLKLINVIWSRYALYSSCSYSS
tara:strand:- start:2 stop:193 length:192 start_codon:yes stop_codon:yes gene_type:complete